ncbi:MAG: serine/threonine protein kinase [Planctomycetaceae bacterium]|nr:serine/threonine protein kinase [Planctomycetaceae bacterium]
MSLLGNLFNDSKEKLPKVDIAKRYNLIARVGQGSMSKVWRAEDAMGGQMLAIKVLDKEKTRKFEARFQGLNKPDEGRIALSLHHPYIVKTLDIGLTMEDEMFLAMEYVEGSGLALLVDLQSEQMRRYRIRYMIQIGEALEYFHKKELLHRDICPRNIMVTESDQIRLIDFGLALPNTPDFRKPGNRTGTANYMAPELIKRQPTDHRIDIFSYAVTCFEMYTKRHPWDAAMTIDAVLQHVNKPPLDIRELVPEIDEQIAKAIMKGLERDPKDRWQSIAEMVKEIREAEVRLVGIVKSAKAHARKQKAAAAKKAAADAAAGATAAKTDGPAVEKTDKPESKPSPGPTDARGEEPAEDEDDFLALPDDDDSETSTDDEMPRLDSNADILAADIDDDDLSLD